MQLRHVGFQSTEAVLDFAHILPDVSLAIQVQVKI